MQVKKLDHVNVHTTNLANMVEWYARVLGMQAGERPPFPFPGAWLYCGGEPTVHLVGVDKLAKAEGLLQLEHFAFSATGLKGSWAVSTATACVTKRARCRAQAPCRSMSGTRTATTSTSTSRPRKSAGIELKEVTTGGMR